MQAQLTGNTLITMLAHRQWYLLQYPAGIATQLSTLRLFLYPTSEHPHLQRTLPHS